MTTLRTAARDARQLWQLCLVGGVLDAGRVRRTVERVIASRRGGRLLVLNSFLRLLKRDRDQHAAKVESAVPLDPSTRAVIESGLARRYGRPMEISFGVEPALIAGLRLRAASEVYDDSLRARLRALESSRT
jgi:F-type H+-transporting ATPase subunit delta